jgi:hypothetical protein
MPRKQSKIRRVPPWPVKGFPPSPTAPLQDTQEEPTLRDFVGMIALVIGIFIIAAAVVVALSS